MNAAEPSAGRLPLLGGRLCLDFTNTAESRGSAKETNFLSSYGDLVAWSRHAGILTEEEAEELLEASRGRAEEAERVLRNAVALRESLYRIFLAGHRGEAPSEEDLAALNAALGEAMANGRVQPSENGFAWAWPQAQALDRILPPIIRSAADLLISEARVGVHACDGCGWLFLDTSRGGRRRWCDMAVCGNRAKRKRHYRRTHPESGEKSG